MRVLVTGARGLIGRHAVSALREAGHEVIALSRGDAGPGSIRCDLLDRESRTRAVADAKADTLLHLAWETRHGVFWTAPENALWQAASADLLRRFFECGGKRAVIAGSCAEYDWEGVSAPLDETAPLAPATPYGRAKAGLFRHCEALIGEGCAIAWGRLFFLMGPGEAPGRFVPALIRDLLAGRRAAMSAGTQIRDFLHAADAGRALAALCAVEATGAFNISRGTGHTLLEIAQMLHRQIGRGELGVGDLPSRSGEPAILVGRNARLEAAIGPLAPMPLAEALADCIRYWRAQPPD